MTSPVPWVIRSRRHITVAVLLSVVALAIARRPQAAAAHPLGNFTINRYAQIALKADAAHIVYALDMAEIPTYQEMDTIDRDQNGTVSDAERSAYLAKKLPELARNLKLTVNGKALNLHVDSGNLSFSDGQGGLKILRIDADFSAAYLEEMPSGVVDAQVRDTNYDDRLGWKEIVVQGTEGAAVTESSVPATGVSDMLRSYPQDALQSPLNVRQAHFRFQRGIAAAPTAANTAALVAKRTSRAVSPGVLSRFAESVATKNLTPPLIAFLVIAAVFWGAVHAVGPGHGKTVVAGYLVGSRGTAKHAVMLGTTVTLTHTASTYLLGFITLFASHYIVPEKLYPVLTLTSGLLVIVLGLTLLVSRLRAAGRWPAARHLRLSLPRLSPAPVLATGGAAVPLTRFPEVRRHHHADLHDHDHDHDLDHGNHCDHEHSHVVPGFDGKPVTWRSLLSLGVYGGLIPCPTAIVVLLTSISLNRAGFGLVLVVAFSFGLAAALTGIGLLLVHAGRLVNRFSAGTVAGRVGRFLPIASAAAVVLAGLVITLRVSGQGWLPLV
jgi:nickel/cobalt transporter (NicO) family protein